MSKHHHNRVYVSNVEKKKKRCVNGKSVTLKHLWACGLDGN